MAPNRDTLGPQDSASQPFYGYAAWLNAIYLPLICGWFAAGVTFGWTIGINVTLVVFLQTPPPLGYGMNADQSSAMYLTPIIAALLGELVGHWLNDFFAKRYIKRVSLVNHCTANSTKWA
jgi:hypothetical protein